jgi:hypothetical protein
VLLLKYVFWNLTPDIFSSIIYKVGFCVCIGYAGRLLILWICSVTLPEFFVDVWPFGLAVLPLLFMF